MNLRDRVKSKLSLQNTQKPENLNKYLNLPELVTRKSSILRKVFGIKEEIKPKKKSDFNQTEFKANAKFETQFVQVKYFPKIAEDSFTPLHSDSRCCRTQKSILMDTRKTVNTYRRLVERPKFFIKNFSLPELKKRNSDYQSDNFIEELSGW